VILHHFPVQIMPNLTSFIIKSTHREVADRASPGLAALPTRQLQLPYQFDFFAATVDCISSIAALALSLRGLPRRNSVIYRSSLGPFLRFTP
jgi:hypothetical protein